MRPGDLAERPLRVDPLGELGLGGLEPLDQPLIGDGRGSVIGQGAEQGQAGLVEVVDPARVRAKGAEHLTVGDQRGGRHRSHVRGEHDAVRDLGVREALVAAVIGRDDQLALLCGVTEDADPDRERQVPNQLLRLRVADAGVHREPHEAVVDEVDHRAVGVEQASHLLDGMREHRQRGRGSGLGRRGHGRRFGIGACGRARHRPVRIRHARTASHRRCRGVCVRHSADSRSRACRGQVSPSCPIPNRRAAAILRQDQSIRCRSRCRATLHLEGFWR